MVVFIQSHYGETSADVTNLSVSIHKKSILQSISVYILQSIFLFKEITIRWGSWHVTNLFPYFDSFRTHSSIHLCLASLIQIWYFFDPHPTFQHNLQSIFVRIESQHGGVVHISRTHVYIFQAYKLHSSIHILQFYTIVNPCRYPYKHTNHNMLRFLIHEDSYHALSCRSFFAKEPLIIRFFCGNDLRIWGILWLYATL